MLKDARSEANLPVQDLDRAKKYYEEKLGLKPSREVPEGSIYSLSDGSTLVLSPSSGRPSGEFTQMVFEVSDAVAEIRALKAKGVVFEDYDTPEIKTVDGIFDGPSYKCGWFKDSEGNLLSVAQMR